MLLTAYLNPSGKTAVTVVCIIPGRLIIMFTLTYDLAEVSAVVHLNLHVILIDKSYE